MDDERPAPIPTDAQLWRRAVGGDSGSFGQLFERHANAIYSFCLRRTGDREAAEDLLSATFLQAWRGRRDRELLDDPLAVRDRGQPGAPELSR